MLSKITFLIGSVLFGLLGIMHIILTFFTNRFQPKDEKLRSVMETASPILSQDISIWKAWIGFNGSHSIGIIFISIMNCYLASRHFDVIQKSDFIFLLNIAVISVYVFLAAKYWFMPPLVGSSIVLVCYLVSYMQVKVL